MPSPALRQCYTTATLLMLPAIAIAIAITMESIEEQWNPPSPPDILSSSWINTADAKKAVKTWLLDQGESWANSDPRIR